MVPSPTAALAAPVSERARHKVLMIEPDPVESARFRDAFERFGMAAAPVRSLDAGARALYVERPDAVILAIEPPIAEGLAVLQRIRDLDDVPVIVVSTSGEPSAIVMALRAGADDYVTRPVGNAELVARAEACLRRYRRGADSPSETLGDDLVSIDLRSVEAHAAGMPLALTPLEFRLLTTLVRNRDRVLSPAELLRLVWGIDWDSATDRVKITIGYLRQRFRSIGVEAPIETVRGFGYRYRSPDGTAPLHRRSLT